MVLQAIRYSRGSLEILDQLKLPHEEVYNQITSLENAWHAIKSMQVRGAPAIAIVAALSVAVTSARDLQIISDQTSLPYSGSAKKAAEQISTDLTFLVTSRPTAVNLADAAKKLKAQAFAASETPGAHSGTVLEAYISGAERMLIDDVRDNENIGEHGSEWIMRHCSRNAPDRKVSVITHCNTGSLATAGYGTALGVVRSLHASKNLQHCYYTETRPYNQGSRLTGFELIHDGIPATLITDSMAAALMKTKSQTENIAAVVVGADRVAANGDTANKIGTYALAVLAKYHGIKFLVAAPRTTIDMNTKSGDDIIIEERPQSEVTNIKAPSVQNTSEKANSHVEEICIAARGTHAWNPAFDVTPAKLIDGIVTEKGVIEKDEDGAFQWGDVAFEWDNTESAPKVKRKRQEKPLGMLPDGITAEESQ